jgi:ubiquinone/menaquinone biosynthesis C-methylase UbiE
MRRPSLIARQAGRPSGFLGRLLLGVMARETSRFNAEVLDALEPNGGENILEIGFGHGRTLLEAARRSPRAAFAGIDVSATATRSAARRCHALISAGRIELRTGDAAATTWAAGTFDAVFSVHTIYFWPDPSMQLAEIRRILRSSGRIVLGLRERTDAALAAFPAPTYRFYSDPEVEALLTSAGFVETQIVAARSGPDLRIVRARAP